MGGENKHRTNEDGEMNMTNYSKLITIVGRIDWNANKDIAENDVYDRVAGANKKFGLQNDSHDQTCRSIKYCSFIRLETLRAETKTKLEFMKGRNMNRVCNANKSEAVIGIAINENVLSIASTSICFNVNQMPSLLKLIPCFIWLYLISYPDDSLWTLSEHFAWNTGLLIGWKRTNVRNHFQLFNHQNYLKCIIVDRLLSIYFS